MDQLLMGVVFIPSRKNNQQFLTKIFKLSCLSLIFSQIAFESNCCRSMSWKVDLIFNFNLLFKYAYMQNQLITYPCLSCQMEAKISYNIVLIQLANSNIAFGGYEF